jgi:hypothetical protein
MKYSKDKLEEIAKDCTSVAQVMKKLGLKPCGGNQTYMRKRLKFLDVDISHFLGNASNRGKAPCNKKKWSDILVHRESENKEKSSRLRRALVEYGREYKCEATGCIIQDQWIGKKITLQIDHKNGNTSDNRPENLRFLCPNCHSQTENWGYKGN